MGQGSTSALATLSTRCPFDSHADVRKLTRLEVSVRVFGISVVFKGTRAGVWGREPGECMFSSEKSRRPEGASSPFKQRV